MVSGWDKNPPPEGERYEPDIGSRGRAILLAIVALAILGSLGWLLVPQP